MVVADSIINAYLDILGGPDFYFTLLSFVFVFSVLYFFYKISD